MLRLLASAITIPSPRDDGDTGSVWSGLCHRWKHKDIRHVGRAPCMGTRRTSVCTGRVCVPGHEGGGRGPGMQAAPGECRCGIWVASVLWQPAGAGIPGKARDGKIIAWRDNHLN